MSDDALLGSRPEVNDQGGRVKASWWPELTFWRLSSKKQRTWALGSGNQQGTDCLASQGLEEKGTEAAGSIAIKPETAYVIPHTHHLTESSAGQLGQLGLTHVTAGSDKTWTSPPQAVHLSRGPPSRAGGFTI